MENNCSALLNSLSIPYSKKDMDDFLYFLEELSLWNTRMNLVGKNSIQDIYAHLLCDSIYLAHLLREYPLKNAFMLDLGAGAGIPGIPLRIFWKEGSYSMVEKRQKRVLFMEHILSKIKLFGTSILYEDADDVLIKNKASCDLIISRAFMPPEKILSYAYRGLKKGALLILMTKERIQTTEDYIVDKEYSYTIASEKRYVICLRAV